MKLYNIFFKHFSFTLLNHERNKNKTECMLHNGSVCISIYRSDSWSTLQRLELMYRNTFYSHCKYTVGN